MSKARIIANFRTVEASLSWLQDARRIHVLLSVRLGVAMPNDGDLADLLLEWVPDEEQRRKVLVDNPARLYGF